MMDDVKDRAGRGNDQMLQPDASLAHPAILGHIRANPGVTIREVAAHLGWSHSSTTNRLNKLARHGMILQVHVGRKRRHYVPEGNPTEIQLRGFLRDKRQARLHAYLRQNTLEGKSMNSIAKALGLPFGFVKRALEELSRIGVIHLERRGHRFVVEMRPETTPGTEGDPQQRNGDA